jgi:chromosome transmission fidelity protein 18
MVDVKYQLEANDNLIEKFIEGLAPSARGGATKGTAAIETVPYSLWMLSAGHGSSSLSRGVSSMEILSKNEKAAFDAHVSTLRSLGLTYVARDDASMRPFNDNKPVAMRLEPQIDRLTQFDDLSLPPGSRRKYVPHVVSGCKDE